MKKHIHLIIVSFILFSCKKNDNPAPANTTPAVTYTNVAYGTDAAQKMDVYLPAGRTSDTTKTMILIHGGAWSSGDKTDFAAFVDTLKTRMPSYAIININYRLSNGTANLFPTQEMDVKAAYEFIYSKRTDYKISDKFVLMGASAGGHLALLQANKYNTPVRPKVVVDFFGPSDMVDLYNNPASVIIPPTAVAQIVGATPTSNPTLYAQSSPVNYINSNSPPTIMLHGGLDPLVKPSHSIAVRDKLLIAGVANKYVFYPTGGHGDWDGATYKDAFNNIQVFVTANVQ